MGKRKRFSETSAFGDTPPATPATSPALGDFTKAIYNSIAEAEAGFDSIEPVSIFEIDPDPQQPRKAIPHAVRQGWHDSGGQADVFTIWQELAQAERGAALDVAAHLQAGGEVERADQHGPIERAFLELIDLAASIRHKGLANPISVVRQSQRYVLETGERRWLAYQLLHRQFPKEKWERIPARVVAQHDVWRQAAENGARQNLNAIGMARQLARLLLDIYTQRGEQFRPLSDILQAAQSERTYYAQVADGNIYRVPKGFGELILNVTGLKSKFQFSQYRALLELPDYLWRIADDLNWSEGTIRQLMQAANGDKALLEHLVARQAQQEGYRLTDVNLLAAADRLTDVNLLAKQTEPEPSADQPVTREMYRPATPTVAYRTMHRLQIRGTFAALQQLDAEKRREIGTLLLEWGQRLLEDSE